MYRLALILLVLTPLLLAAKPMRPAGQGIPWKSAALGIQLDWDEGPRIALDGFLVECGVAPDTYRYTTALPPETTAVKVRDIVPTQGEYYCQMTVFFGEDVLISNELHFTCEKRRCYVL